MSKRICTDDFIRMAKEIHGDKYDYSKVEYKKAMKDVRIICPIHGEFLQKPHDHLRGHGCKFCGHEKTTKSIFKWTRESFIKKSREVHGDKYDYSKVEYKGYNDKVCIICPEHGEFYCTPANHFKGRGCRECRKIKMSKTFSMGKDGFLKRAKEIHGDKYDYSKVEYVNNSTPINIICPIHGEFLQSPAIHLRGGGCPKCAGRNLSTEEFVAKSREVHGDKYDYSKVEYKDASRTKICIICPEHGEFWQMPNNHLLGHGCPCCNNGLTKRYKFNLLQEFESEYELRAFLENNDVNILYVILRNVEPKFEPIKGDIEKALKNIELKDPIKALEDKYAKDDEEETEETSTDSKEEDVTTVDITNVDLDDDDAVNDVIGTKENEEEEDTNTEPTIEDVIKNHDKEVEVATRIEHMLTPEDREYIMEKFLNDETRIWMANREKLKNI